jgi:hypothetical protein
LTLLKLSVIFALFAHHQVSIKLTRLSGRLRQLRAPWRALA